VLRSVLVRRLLNVNRNEGSNVDRSKKKDQLMYKSMYVFYMYKEPQNWK
jgi:hypothetical protein